MVSTLDVVERRQAFRCERGVRGPEKRVEKESVKDRLRLPMGRKSLIEATFGVSEG